MTLPGVSLLHAETPPERGAISIKHLDYQDSQPGFERIHVVTDALYASLPINDEWSADALVAVDTVSGASPSYHSERASAAQMHDTRHAQSVSLTRYFPQATLGLGVSHSKESDYVSDTYSLKGSISSEDKNTTLNLGIAGNFDEINSVFAGVDHEPKRGIELIAGLTQILTANDIVQLSLSHADGHGFFSDPYKFFDNRPRKRRQSAAVAKWNHYVKTWDSTERLSYRYYLDSFGIAAHTLTFEHVQPLSGGWTLSPLLRIYSQSAADFYVDPTNPPFPTIPSGFQPGTTIISQDQRLSAFGARTLSLKLAKQLTPDWLADLKYEYYEQRSAWRLGGSGSPGLEPFRARSISVGLTRLF